MHKKCSEIRKSAETPGKTVLFHFSFSDINRSLEFKLDAKSAQVKLIPAFMKLLAELFGEKDEEKDSQKRFRVRIQNKRYLLASNISDDQEREQDKAARVQRSAEVGQQTVTLRMHGDLVPSTSGLGSSGRVSTEQPKVVI